MNRLAKQLDEKLSTLDPARAQHLESLVRDALDQVGREKVCDSTSGWPTDYFQQTAGALAGEDFARPPQGELPVRDDG